MKYYLLILSLMVLAAGCGRGVTVIADKKDLSSGWLTIDGRQRYEFHDSVLALQLPIGLHRVAVNGGPEREFNAGPNGGLLNLDDQEYVAFEVEYTNPADKEPVMELRPKAVIRIDSFVVMAKDPAFPSLPDTAFRQFIPGLLAAKNGNFIDDAAVDGAHYDTDQSFYALKRFGKGKLYVEKFWDYDLNSEVPESLLVPTPRNRSTALPVKDARRKVAVMRAPDFLNVVQQLPELYYVKDIRQLQRPDAVR